MKILVIEDDKTVGEYVRRGLDEAQLQLRRVERNEIDATAATTQAVSTKPKLEGQRKTTETGQRAGKQDPPSLEVARAALAAAARTLAAAEAEPAAVRARAASRRSSAG